ncbi:hypothetical protein CHLNCDRAFT_142910 [Chlorella variabilis]|uniref:Peroxin-13 n=1 Tax=Chlorella variabilis TaxID=554065 RepID=E1Z916_CHLVA|nr:hypothetical protein CHLNCDRAFT_142910 [Chlorella variabilis]EFN57437.1 hypothetical protein CHLNCDRAFT_142910 [Chlorella variabilis]|eukprot:XP_005849539.1 hypothetical protein CHLNCDRAFT_142910 [Chlorella variabilis]
MAGKPWERSRPGQGTSSPADGLPKPWERPAGAPTQTVTPAAATTSALAAVTSGSGGGAAQAPPRPWEHQGGAVTSAASTSYGAGYGSGYGTSLYNRPQTAYGGGMYGGGYGGSMYGSYGSGMYGGGGFGGGMYGRPAMYGGGGMYGSGMYGGYGGGGMYGPGMMGPYDPNDPNAPPQPPSAWQAMLHAISGVVHFFGRLSFLVDENAHAVHFFISALLQLLDRFGSLYGELARFVLRLLGFKPRDKKTAALGGASGQWESLWSK